LFVFFVFFLNKQELYRGRKNGEREKGNNKVCMVEEKNIFYIFFPSKFQRWKKILKEKKAKLKKRIIDCYIERKI